MSCTSNLWAWILLLKLTNTFTERFNLVFLLHNFSSCLNEQTIFVTFKKRSSQIWRISVCENRHSWHWFSGSSLLCSKQCSRFPRCNWHSRGFTVFSTLQYAVVKQAFSVVLHLQDPSLAMLSADVLIGMHLRTGGKTSLHQLFQIHPWKSVIDLLINLSCDWCRSVTRFVVKLNSFWAWGFQARIASVSMALHLNRFWLITCERWDIRRSAVEHRGVFMDRIPKVLCVKVGPSERKEKWMTMGEILTCACGQLSGEERNETWHVDDSYFKDTKMCNPELSSSWVTCDEMWSCCHGSVRAVFVGVLFTKSLKSSKSMPFRNPTGIVVFSSLVFCRH